MSHREARVSVTVTVTFTAIFTVAVYAFYAFYAWWIHFPVAVAVAVQVYSRFIWCRSAWKQCNAHSANANTLLAIDECAM